jgi:hypothetical protein
MAVRQCSEDGHGCDDKTREAPFCGPSLVRGSLKRWRGSADRLPTVIVQMIFGGAMWRSSDLTC